ncbi:hypothetical protein [Amycolatopsis panacis]|uniref:hypothetical protein n=1 Tax=Amycolatopsis panacis TaxID=2340917 RepID=UPI0018F3B9AB|nr:hypothetical protein [Amycolatopsis panacis]
MKGPFTDLYTDFAGTLGVTLTRWLRARRKRAGELFADGRFPLLAKIHEETVPDLDGLFEYSLVRHLDGFAVLVRERPGG